MAKIVSNAAGFSDEVSGQHYADVPSQGEGSQFYIWIMRLTSRGVMGGYACGGNAPGSGPCDGQNRPYFRPGNEVTRGQASKIVASITTTVRFTAPKADELQARIGRPFGTLCPSSLVAHA